MGRVQVARDAWVAGIAATGLRATADSRTVNPPCVVLDARPSRLPVGNNCSNWLLQWTMHVVEKGGDNLVTADRLDDMLDTVMGVLDPTSVESCDPDVLTFGDQPFPVYTIQFRQVI